MIHFCAKYVRIGHCSQNAAGVEWYDWKNVQKPSGRLEK